jgi:NAD(P)H-dependent nitrite reductase small subunit
MAFVRVASINDVPEGEGKVVKANGRELALFKLGGEFYAIDNTCKHMGGPLGEGWLEDSIVTCPLHGWRYDIKTGICQMFPNIKVDSFPVKVEGDDVLIDV